MRRSRLRVVAAIGLATMMFGAGAAQAATFTAAEYPAFVSGEQIGSGSTSGSLGFESKLMVECGVAGFAGEITEAAGELTVSPGFGECSAFGFAEATVEANGCSLVLQAGSESETGFTGTFDIACPAGKKIVVIGGTCEVQIGAQTGVGPVLYENTGIEPTEVKALFPTNPASGFTYTKTVDGLLCPLAGTGVKTDGVMIGGALVKAGNQETLEPIDFRIE